MRARTQDLWRYLLNKSYIILESEVKDVTLSDEYVIEIYFPFYKAR